MTPASSMARFLGTAPGARSTMNRNRRQFVTLAAAASACCAFQIGRAHV